MRVSRFVVAWVLAGVVVRGVEAQSPAEDCNFNGVLDSVEIAGGLSDCNADGIPDECELSPALSFEDPVVQRFGGFQVDPSMLERGDLDGDGLEDFATVWRNTVVLLWNEGGGDFEIESRRTATLSSTSGTSFQLLQLADLDGDGLPELLIAGSLVPGMLATFSNLGNRRFGDREVLPFPFPFSGNPNSLVRSIHAGHFDGDDREDLAVLIGHEPDHSVQILLNRRGELTQGPGVSLSSDRTDGPNSAPSVFVGDFDGDGRDDLLRTLRRAEDVPETAPGTVPTYRVIWNQGVGNFFAPVDLIPNRNVFGDPQIVDIDGDGADEIYFVQALVTAAPEFQSRDVQTSFAFSGIGRSFELTRYSLGTRTVLWGDLDLDGDSDAVTIRGSRGGLATVFENLEGNLTQSTSLGRLPASLLSDFDADGRLDLVGFQNQATISRRNENGFEFASEEIVAPLLSESTFVVALPPAPNSTVPRIAAASLGDTRFYIVGESNGFVEIGYGGLVDAATADLNRDGIADMIVAHEGGTTIALANESGFFDSTDREVVESGPVHSVRAEDLDGDG
ncbi:MAG: VCBS repeat-containing protein, partial [Planctomycetota bacterium]